MTAVEARLHYGREHHGDHIVVAHAVREGDFNAEELAYARFLGIDTADTGSAEGRRLAHIARTGLNGPVPRGWTQHSTARGRAARWARRACQKAAPLQAGETIWADCRRVLL